MKKNIIFTIVCLLLIIIVLWIIFTYFVNKNQVTPIRTIVNPVAIDQEEQKYCDSLGPQEGAASIKTHFVSNMRENMVLKNNFEVLGCIKNINNSFGVWEKQDGYIATYEIRTTNGVLVSRGVMPINQDIMELENLSRLNSHIPFSKFIVLGNTNNEKLGNISIRNINSGGDPTGDKNIVFQVAFE